MKRIWGAMFLIALSFGVMSLLIPMYSKEVGLSGAEIGGLFSVFSLVILLSKPLIGKWLDRASYKPVLTMGMFMYAIGFVAFAYMEKGAALY
ncbi:MAG: MFS transporter, partial [Cellulosilyticaceae bacterium]